MNVDVSIIIPVYNAEKTLVRCVESILYGKKRSNIEVILVEDRSPDSSWKVCRMLEEEYASVRCLQNEKNSGVSYTRNRGIDAATGKYVLFVDSDDWVSGTYAEELLHVVRSYERDLVLCGYWFFNRVAKTTQKFVYCENEEVTRVDQDELFALSAAVLMQQLWNKIFRLDVIRQYGLRFDETQSMGEDFQFVLDYMRAAQPAGCVVLNRPLYYYIRANSSSLMSKFGLTEQEAESNRLHMLWELTGDMENTRAQYERACENAKLAKLYQIARCGLSREEKLAHIERVMCDGKAAQHDRAQRRTICKERLHGLLTAARGLVSRAENRMRREKRDRLARRMKARLTARDFTVVSQNCIGGVFYHDMGLQFYSPTVNLYFTAADFVKFVLNLKYYLSLTPEMRWEGEYPVGKLDDIEIHFMHYETCTQARQAWERRKARVKWDRIIVLCTDQEGFDDAAYTAWRQIPYPKLLFTAQACFAEERDSVFYPWYERNGCVKDLIPMREFYKEGRLVRKINQKF